MAFNLNEKLGKADCKGVKKVASKYGLKVVCDEEDPFNLNEALPEADSKGVMQVASKYGIDVVQEKK